MKIVNILFAIYWAMLGILTIAGVYTPTPITIVCGFFCAALGFAGYAMGN